MKVFTEFELQQFEGYDQLKKVLNSAEIQFFYNQPRGTRAETLGDKIITRTIRGVKMGDMGDGTQMCLTNKQIVCNMAILELGRDFEVDGMTFNLKKLGWTFNLFHSIKAFGVCQRRVKNISLSGWMIEHCDKSFADWRDTMLHEIAHAIDIELRGYSNHDKHWMDIAHTIGSKGVEFATYTRFKDTIDTLYYVQCPSCSHTVPLNQHLSAFELSLTSCGCGRTNLVQHKTLVRHNCVPTGKVL